MLTIVYITYDDKKFRDEKTRFVEIATEVLLWVVCTFIQQLILPLTDVEIADLQIMIFVSIGLLIIVNVSFVVYSVRLNCKDKTRLQLREKRRVVWENAWKEVDKSRPTRFTKQRTYVRGSPGTGAAAVNGPLPAIEEEKESQSRVQKSALEISSCSSFSGNQSPRNQPTQQQSYLRPPNKDLMNAIGG